MKPRESGPDLFRCMGFLFVTGLHACLYNGFYYEPQAGAAMWAANSFRWLFFGCNGMFMLLTGYLRGEKPVDRRFYRGLLPVLVGYLLTCLISYPIRHFLLGDQASFGEWIQRLFTFSNYAWYLEMYIGLILLSPLVNLVLKQLTQTRQLLWLAGTMVLVTTAPTLTPLPLLPDHWTAMYPLTYYTLGAVIRRLQPKLPGWAALLGAAATVMLQGLLTLLSIPGGHFNDGFPQGGYGGFFTMLAVTLLFLGVYRFRAGPRLQKLLAWLAGGVMEGYILSRLFDVWIYGKVDFWHSPQTYPLIFLCVTIPVFLVSITAGHYVHKLSVWLTRERPRN